MHEDLKLTPSERGYVIISLALLEVIIVACIRGFYLYGEPISQGIIYVFEYITSWSFLPFFTAVVCTLILWINVYENLPVGD